MNYALITCLILIVRHLKNAKTNDDALDGDENALCDFFLP